MKRILIDMDDVLADTFSKIVQKVNEATGKNWQATTIKTVGNFDEFAKDYVPVRDFLWQKGFFSDLKPMPHAKEVVAQLQQSYEIFIVSAATEFPLSMAEKLDWLAEHFPNIGWEHTVFCGHKHMIRADYIIDDHEKNLSKFVGTGLLFDAPHNQHVEGHLRMHNWQQVQNYLLG
jgi:5'-nucleotidase